MTFWILLYMIIFLAAIHPYFIVQCTTLRRTYNLDYSEESKEQDLTEWESCTGMVLTFD